MSSKFDYKPPFEIPEGLDEIIETYGSLNEHFERDNIVLFDLPYPIRYAGKPVTRSRAHKKCVPIFQAVFEQIKKEGLTDYANDYSGIYQQRGIRGYPKFPSTHSWGIAIDLEAEDNPMGTKGTLHPRIIEIFETAGAVWGGRFKSRFDPMHFQFAKKY